MVIIYIKKCECLCESKCKLFSLLVNLDSRVFRVNSLQPHEIYSRFESITIQCELVLLIISHAMDLLNTLIHCKKCICI